MSKARTVNVELFWAKVNKNGPIPESCPELGPCWLWTKGPEGYGVFRSGRRTVKVHRLSYELAFGPIPMDATSSHGTCVLHRCDVPACVNPRHLFLGSHQTNMDDMARKGRKRVATGDRNAARARPEIRQGERNGRAKVTADDVRAIRTARARGEAAVSIALRFGLSPYGVWRICTGKRWCHLGSPSGLGNEAS